jgi:hypothetical protein
VAYTTLRRLDSRVSAHKRDDAAVEESAIRVVAELERLGLSPVGAVDLTGAGFHRIATYLLSAQRTSVAVVSQPATTFVSVFGGRVFSTTDRPLAAPARFELRQVEPETPVARLWRIHEAGLRRIAAFGAQPDRLHPARAIDTCLEIDRRIRTAAVPWVEAVAGVKRTLRMDRANPPLGDDRRADRRIRNWLALAEDPIRV